MVWRQINCSNGIRGKGILTTLLSSFLQHRTKILSNSRTQHNTTHGNQFLKRFLKFISLWVLFWSKPEHKCFIQTGNGQARLPVELSWEKKSLLQVRSWLLRVKFIVIGRYSYSLKTCKLSKIKWMFTIKASSGYTLCCI